MCGVIGLIYERERADLGVVAGELLRTLEYRGYDSTGAAIQGAGEEVTLRKGVGAPSVLVKSLGIVDLGGQILCGQVRWATFGAVDEANSQPHVVRCHTYLYGAHNGNVTNCDGLKESLTADGHTVLSDNDGEMVVHAVEHAFAARLAELPEELRRDNPSRAVALRQAVVSANVRIEGSYAAVIVDPVSRVVCAVKKGSSLYFGLGESDEGGRFCITSSDMSSVLKLTRHVVPLLENEFVQFDALGYQVYDLRDGGEQGAGVPLDRSAVRSRLASKDTELRDGFSSFMEQEIDDQADTSRDVIRIFERGSQSARDAAPLIAGWNGQGRGAVDDLGEELLNEENDAGWFGQLAKFSDLPQFKKLSGHLAASGHSSGAGSSCPPLWSSERAFLGDLWKAARDDGERSTVATLDAYWEAREVAEDIAVIDAFCTACLNALEHSGRLYVVCCGTSYHAAKVAALFFAELAGLELTPLLPGEFRGQHSATLRDGDLLIAVSQSGETKDLIDVVNSVIASGRDVIRIALVNNVNSTLAQEKSDIVLPLHCGPEIAVPATKSFINQLTMFFGLALELAGRHPRSEADLAARREGFLAIPSLIERTLAETNNATDQAAKMLFLAPSMHLLATRLIGVAKEGALKVREVVLNHTEGFEGSEFKHGPNTILGFNTIFGPQQLDGLLDALKERLAVALQNGQDTGAALDGVFAERGPMLNEMCVDYPLVYITGPESKDVALTVSQLNTHKIRGAITVVIAEEHVALRKAAEKCPADNPDYKSIYIALPPTGDTLLTVFTSIVALQRLALKMSVAKLAWLEERGVVDHGVHPDVPKNVSKSITVD
ncbi:MAG: glucosamine--fructose-6-phosphate aminotransferase (isomerizing) [Pseudohongiellaceae bacterium]